LSTALAAPSIAETVLGSEWRPAGDFAALFSPILLLSAIVSPISIFLYLLNRQDLDFRLQAFRLAASFLGMLAGYALMPTPSGLLLGYVLATALKYLVEFSLIWFTVKSAPPTESR